MSVQHQLLEEERCNLSNRQNRLAACSYNGNSCSYIYGSDGYRHRSIVNGTSTDFALDGDNVIREIRAGVNQATYFMGATGPSYRRDDVTGLVRWYLYGGLGSVVGEVDPSGNVTGTRKTDVYGIQRSSTGTITSKHGFVGGLGHMSEPETGLVYMRARYMDPAVGRFASEDPSQDGDNWFEYAWSSPTNGADPSGESYMSILTGVVMGIALVTGECLGYYLATLLLEDLNKGYHGGANRSALIFGIGSAISGMALGILADIGDVLKGQMSLTAYAKGLARAAGRGAGGGLGRVALLGGIAFVVGIVLGTLQAVEEYYASDYYQSGGGA